MSDLTDNENWAPTGLPHFEVSDLGNIRDVWTGSRRKPYIDPSGKLVVQYRHPDEFDHLYTLPVAKLVLQAFVGSHPDPSKTMPVHLDGDFANCHLENLKWDSRYGAKAYYKRLGFS